mmetsp:Transcript_26634/g.84755  ORF Transcript_26634/g.84755 Transcript_26634/m.84755 type:complete len:334 (+) Transcript_26634:1074-2075(+)
MSASTTIASALPQLLQQGGILELQRLYLFLLQAHRLRDDSIRLASGIELGQELVRALREGLDLGLHLLHLLAHLNLDLLVRLQLVEQEAQPAPHRADLFFGRHALLVLFELDLDLLAASVCQLAVVRLERADLVEQDLFVELGLDALLAFLGRLFKKAGTLLLDRRQLLLALAQLLHALVLAELGELEALEELEHLLGHLAQLLPAVPRLGFHAQALLLRIAGPLLQLGVAPSQVLLGDRQVAVRFLLVPLGLGLHLELGLELNRARVQRPHFLGHGRRLVLGLALGLLCGLHLFEQAVLLFFADSQLLLQRLHLDLRLALHFGVLHAKLLAL